MKKLINGTLFLALVGVVVMGCKKEASLPNSTENNGLISKNNITSSNGILIFGSWDDAFVFMNEVVRKNEVNVNSFYKLYKNFSDDELDSIQEVTGWEYNQAYIDIENQFHYKSLLTYVDDKLYKEELNIEEKNYWDQFLVEDDLGSILNHESLVQVGDSIYKFLQDMSVVVTTISNLDFLKSLTEDNVESNLENIRLKIYGFEPKGSLPCRANRKRASQNWWNYQGGGTRTIKGWIVIRNIPLFGQPAVIRYVRAITKTERYSEKHGRNVKWVTDIGAATSGEIFRNKQPYFCKGTKEGCASSAADLSHRVTSTYKDQQINALKIFAS